MESAVDRSLYLKLSMFHILSPLGDLYVVALFPGLTCDYLWESIKSGPLSSSHHYRKSRPWKAHNDYHQWKQTLFLKLERFQNQDTISLLLLGMPSLVRIKSQWWLWNIWIMVYYMMFSIMNTGTGRRNCFTHLMGYCTGFIFSQRCLAWCYPWSPEGSKYADR